MDELLVKYNDYMRLVDCKVEYKLENGQKIEFFYKEENFPHLIGLHKLKDLQLIQFWQDRNNKTVKLETLIRRIKNSTFTDSMVKSSAFFPQIKERYESFSYDNLTTLNYTNAVINFNPLMIKSKIKSDYLLYEVKQNNEYNHMGIALNKATGNRYVETFFHESTDMYINGQKTVKVKSFTLYDNNNDIIVVDSF